MVRSALICADAPFIRKLVSTTLEDVAGFHLYEAANGLEAVERAAEVQPALVFLDIDMPRMDGITASRRLTSQCGGWRVSPPAESCGLRSTAGRTRPS